MKYTYNVGEMKKKVLDLLRSKKAFLLDEFTLHIPEHSCFTN